MTVARGLRLVPYSPSDYSLGEILSRDDGFSTQDSAQIASALSLYFQWEESRCASIFYGQSNFVPCVLDYDRDERQPSELRIRQSSTAEAGKYEMFQKVSIRFEVFQVCYEFTAEVLAVSEQPKMDEWDLIVSIPSILTVFKARRLPRIELDSDAISLLKDSTWVSEGNGPVSIEINEIGLKGILAKIFISTVKISKGTLNILGKEFQAELIRIVNGKAIFVLKPNNGAEYGAYFDVYRRFAYPHLRPRSDFSSDQGIELYRSTNYFGKFLTESDATSAYEEIKRTWSLVDSGNHETTADYFVVDDQNQPIGASSATLAFFKDESHMWAFHQLCAKNSPEFLPLTLELYSWRAEYLAGKDGAISSIGWFDSKSRWLERIYVKFITQRKGKSKLSAVKTYKVHFIPDNSDDHSFLINRVKIGKSERIMLSDGHLVGGCNPAYLNASQTLNAVIAIDEGVQSSSVMKAGAVMANLQKMQLSLDVSFISEPIESSNFIPINGADRFFVLIKEDLVDFISSIHHSVAITQRKING